MDTDLPRQARSLDAWAAPRPSRGAGTRRLSAHLGFPHPVVGLPPGPSQAFRHLTRPRSASQCGHGLAASVAFEEGSGGVVVGFEVEVGEGSFPVLDDAFGGADVADGEECFDHDAGEWVGQW